MDSSKFERAKALYDSGDYRAAASGFLDAVDPGTPVGNGPAYHLGGNALLKLKRFADAIKVFEMALADDAYGKRSALQLNIAAAYLQDGDLSAAVTHYEAAIAEADCNAPYRAYNGMGKALMKQKRFDEAAVAYRRATLDGQNPDPGRSLVQLGVCLAAVGKPEDAISAYQGALSLESFKNRPLALVNLGFAYHALHRWAEAVRSFEEAQERYGATLSSDSEAALKYARAMVACAEDDGCDPAGEPTDAPVEMPDDLAVLVPLTSEETPAASEHMAQMTSAMPVLGETAVEEYFQMSEKEAARRGREMARANRPKYAWVRTLVGVAVIVLLVAASVGGAWYTGFGVPTAPDAVSNLMDAYNTGKPFVGMWVSGSTNITREMAQIPVAEYTVGEVVVSGLTADVAVTVTPEEGDPIEFRFGVAREGIGWKVSEVEPQY